MLQGSVYSSPFPDPLSSLSLFNCYTKSVEKQISQIKSSTWTACRCLHPKGKNIVSSFFHSCSKCMYGLRTAGCTQILARYGWNKHLKELAPSWAYYCKHHLSDFENWHLSQTPFIYLQIAGRLYPSSQNWPLWFMQPLTQWLQRKPRTKATWSNNLQLPLQVSACLFGSTCPPRLLTPRPYNLPFYCWHSMIVLDNTSHTLQNI